jgi:hypothetical protein
MKMSLKECKDEGGCKGIGSVHDFSRHEEEFQRSTMEFVMESFEANIFSKDVVRSLYYSCNPYTIIVCPI